MEPGMSVKCDKKCHTVKSVGIPFYNVVTGIKGGSMGGAMPDHPEKGGVLEVTCPCCEARLTVDPASGAVLGSEKAAHARAGVDLKDAQRVLEQETARIHERYDQIVRTEKGRGAALDKLFKTHIEKSKDEPAPRPIRDIDLD
jgi:hypothetical protein